MIGSDRAALGLPDSADDEAVRAAIHAKVGTKEHDADGSRDAAILLHCTAPPARSTSVPPGNEAMRVVAGQVGRRSQPASSSRRCPASERGLIGVSAAGDGDYARNVAADRPEPHPDEPDLPGGPLVAAFAGGRRQRLRPGTVLFSEGDASSRVVLLVSGRVKVSSLSEDGHETILGYRGAGDVLGELSAIDGEEHLATVTVLEAGEALVLPADRFLAALEGQPGLALVLLRSIVGRLRDADRKRAEFTALDVVGRVAHRLVELAERYGQPADGGILIDLPISQRELAGWVGSSREAVNKALQQLERRGLIATERRHLVVLDLEGLRGRAS